VRIVRFVALIAGHAAGVLGGNHLREGTRFGGVLFVAADAESGDRRQLGNEGGWIVGMFGEGAVAGFAGDPGVFAFGADLALVLVAKYALLLARVGDGALADEIERAGAIVSILTKVFGDHGLAEREEERKSCENNGCRPNQVPGIAKELTHRQGMSNTNTKRPDNRKYKILP
jgi:hypothetical protein